MPLRSTERSNGRKRPGWRGDARFTVEDQQALATTEAVTARNVNGKIEHEYDLTRERRGALKADAGSQIGSRRDAEACLAILLYEFFCQLRHPPSPSGAPAALFHAGQAGRLLR